MSSERLTGRSRVRQGITGWWFRRRAVLVLQLEYSREEYEDDGTHANSGYEDHYTVYEWRDATVEDYVVYATSAVNTQPPAPTPPREREYPTNIKPLTVPRNNGLAPTAGPKGKLP